MTMEKTHVPLSSIVPSDNNPRQDFGDIDALAAAIRATNSQCVNPPIVVRDGNAYRIVDGERRYRALRKIWHALPDRVVEVLVCSGYDEADEAVAMLATDDKKPLTEAERAAGTQRMLLLGVEDVRVAGAAHADEEVVHRARRMAKKVGEGYVCTIEQLAAAADLEDEEDAQAVMEAGEEWRWVANNRARLQRQRREFEDLCEAVRERGCTVLEKGAEDPDAGEWHRVCYVSYAEKVAEDEGLADMTGWQAVPWNSSLALWAPGPAEVDAEAEELRRIREENKVFTAQALGSMCRFVAGVDEGQVSLRDAAAWAEAHPALACEVVASRCELGEGFGWPWEPSADTERVALLASAPSSYEVARWVAGKTSGAGFLVSYNGRPAVWACQSFAALYDLCAEDGWQPDAKAEELRQYCADAEGAAE